MLKGLKKTARGSIVYGLGNISTKLVGIVLMPLYTDTKIFSVNDFGVLGVVDVTIQVLVALLGLSLYQAYFRWYWDKKHTDDRKSIFFTLFSFLGLTGGIFVVLGAFASQNLSTLLFDSVDYSRVLSLMVISVVLQILAQLPLSLMRLEERAGLYTVTNLTRLFVTLILTVLFITKFDRWLEGIYEAQILGNLFFMLITALYSYRRSVLKLKLQVLKDMLEYSLPLTVASVSGIALATLDRYVLNYRATLLDVGIYTTAFRFANTIRVFVVHSIQLAVAPTIFKLMDHPDNKEIYSRIMTYFAVLVIYASLVLSIFGAEILDLFVTDKVYHKALFVIPILSLGILLSTIKDVAINGLNIVKKTKIVSVIVPIVAVFHLALSYLVIPVFGVYGAAVASAISQSIFLLVVLYFAQRYYPIPYEYKRIIVSFCIALVMLVVGINITFSSVLLNITLKLAIAALFPLVIWLIPFLKPDERQWVVVGLARIRRILFRS
ncbi:lipopolysaccharide biosynthesis protein [Perlabentimonas gracilis]|uniref:lipopolysaccharide biosynthesis protein n=1 Tax=Perlabentimonas gracilis TaxID=2715279 RepID=UPI00140AA002|nr:polysaccharide biosynthesis C-terminal domain-containing protein [Perlabentimonas gracilis]NHB67749.1 oligosaccharide flippase family protein [Perlabentimonas gracilis]